jgi:hypothetical protein
MTNNLNENFPNFRDIIFQLIIVKSDVDIGYRNCSNYFPINPLKALHALYQGAQCTGQGCVDNIEQRESKFLAFEIECECFLFLVMIKLRVLVLLIDNFIIYFNDQTFLQSHMN